MSELPLRQIIEGAILAADSPLSVDHMIQLFEKNPPSRSEIRDVLKAIEESCSERGFELTQVSSGYRFQVKTEYGEWVSRLWEDRPPRYSRALLETLALIAYKQPLTRGDIEDVRGVAVSTNIIRTLMEREWIRVVGHRDVPGRPAIYATTRHFLDYFNLTSLDDLPTLSEIKDLDHVNEELDLDEPGTGMVIELEEVMSGEEEGNPVSDEELDQVTAQVNTISDNIRNLFNESDEGSEEADDEEGEIQGADANESGLISADASGADQDPPESSGSEEDAASHRESAVPDSAKESAEEPTSNEQTRTERFPNVPKEILDAAFQDDETDDS